MKYTRTDEGDQTTPGIEGALEEGNAHELNSAVDEIGSLPSRSVTLDLSGLNLIDSNGVAVVVKLFKRTRASGGHLMVVGVKDQPRAIFNLLRLDKVFKY
jgi:anti-sigma B factor antagonist